MNHEMVITRIGFFGAIVCYCPCGWTSKQITGDSKKQIKKASKAYSNHMKAIKRVSV